MGRGGARRQARRRAPSAATATMRLGPESRSSLTHPPPVFPLYTTTHRCTALARASGRAGGALQQHATRCVRGVLAAVCG